MVAVTSRPDTRVLVADSCAHGRCQLRSLLNGLGLRRIYEAADGAEAVAFLEAAAPSLIVIDWDLPVVPAPELIHLARGASGATGASPAILVTIASPQRDAVAAAIGSGIRNIVAKPYSARLMRSRLELARRSQEG